ncbi:MAG: PEGA domain-containing protein [Betaproteobacteria bacterium]|nr:PEGA domain-containing protein [Betaproteobacteria bacterium]
MERGNKTFICSVVFLDIVEYSKKPVAEQIRLKERFNALLSTAIQDVAANDRIILDTGDGAAISFLGDPEDALFVAMSLRDAVVVAGPAETVPLQLRIGINLGPVRLVTDINGQPNIIGDGINVAQRIMSFAQINQVLIARSYYEVVSRLSEEYAQLFNYEGSRTDKHVREHEVYALGYPSVRIARPAAMRGAEPASRGGGIRSPAGLRTGPQAVAALVLSWWRTRQFRIALVVAVAAALVLGTVIRGLKTAPEQRRSADSVAAVESTRSPAQKPEAPGARQSVGEPDRTRPAQSSPAAPARPESLPPRAQEALREGKLARTEGAAGLAPSQTAFISLAITPWGEVYVDGKLQGVSPPLRFVQVAPGRHRIEIRNSSFPPYFETIAAKADERIRIKHKF